MARKNITTTMSAGFRIGSPRGIWGYFRPWRPYTTSGNHSQNNFLFLAIGNPAPEYSGTRHNVGHWALERVVNDALIPGFGAFQVSRVLGIEASVNSLASNVLLAKTTQTYMNMLGPAVSKAWQRFQRQHSNGMCHLVIFHDELEVALGKVQVRQRRTSARGHNGLRSIDKCLGNDYTKVGIGVGKPTRGSVADHVLSRFTTRELEVLESKSLPRVYEAMQAMMGGDYIHESR